MITKRVRKFYKNKMSYDKMAFKLKILHEMLNNDDLIIKFINFHEFTYLDLVG